MPWAKPTFYWHHVLADLTATSTATGYDVANLLDRREDTFWKATSGATQYITNDFLISSFLTTADGRGSATNSTGIAIAQDGSIWFSDSNTNTIYHVDSTTGLTISSFLTSVFDASATNTQDVAVDRDGNLWAIDSNTNKVYKIKTDGTWISEFATSVFDSGATNISGISVAENGTLLLTDAGVETAYNVEIDGTLISKFLTSTFDVSATAPTGICESSNLTWRVSDLDSDKIYNIAKDGTLISSFATTVYASSATNTKGIDEAKNGTLWSIDSNANTIFNIPRSCSADYLLISGHNLNTVGAKITLQYSSDNFAADINDAIVYVPKDDKTIVLEFDKIEARYTRLKIEDATAAPYMALAYWGDKMELKYATASFDPHGEREHVNQNVSQTGVLLGDYEDYIEWDLKISIASVITDGPHDRALQDWKRTVGRLPFGVAWEKTSHVSDI